MFDGGISGFGYNSQLTQWAACRGACANYGRHRPAHRRHHRGARKEPELEPFQERCPPPLTKGATHGVAQHYDIRWSSPTVSNYNDGRWFGSEAMWKSNYTLSWLPSRFRASMGRDDRPSGGRPTDAEVKL